MTFVKMALVGAVAVAALGIGCSSTSSATPRVTVNTQMGPGDEAGVNDSGKCLLATTPWVVIGDTLHPVDNGDQQSGASVSVSCSVKTEGTGFQVSGSATLQGQGSLTITGHFEPRAGDPPADQAGIRAVFQRGDTGTFKQDDCTVSYANNPNMGVAAGRVWGQITCPHATYDQQGRTCLGSGEFRFENCSQ